MHDGTYKKTNYTAEYFHHDGDFDPPGENFMWTFLHSKIKPPIGGSTNFLDLVTGYKSLSEDEIMKLQDAYLTIDINEYFLFS